MGGLAADSDSEAQVINRSVTASGAGITSGQLPVSQSGTPATVRVRGLARVDFNLKYYSS